MLTILRTGVCKKEADKISSKLSWVCSIPEEVLPYPGAPLVVASEADVGCYYNWAPNIAGTASIGA